MKKALKYYEDNIIKFKEELRSLEKELIIFSSIRFVIVAIALIMVYFAYKRDNINGMIIIAIISVITFMLIAFVHNGKINKKNKILIMLEYNEKGKKRLNGDWKSFVDTGVEFIEEDNQFASDLDIFGKNSLFQWINITITKFGRESLAEKLMLKNIPTRYEIKDNQEAIKELADKREFCEKIYLEAYREKKEKDKLDLLIKWINEKSDNNFTIRFIPYFFITITSILLFLTVIGRLEIKYLLLDLVINYLVIKLLTRRLTDVIDIFISNKKKIVQYSNILSIIQEENFKSDKLVKLQKGLFSRDISCKKQMAKLKNIINWLGDSNANAYYLIINVIFMSDIFILYNLEKWKSTNGENLEKWLKIMGEIESLISLSSLAFEHEDWVYPSISGANEIEIVDGGHPLLGDRAKVNSFKLSNSEKVALITGSNMSGKSTFLRTIGFNMVLSYLGLPTFSKSFKCGIYNIYTCMRTQDNLEENISSFYAEILRIKLVIEGAKRGEKVFFLLDEIFKGTNSRDRHEGAKILIEQLVKLDGMGLVSTHDLELCNLENERKWLVNYNFREYYKNNEIHFDYILRKGKSETQNARHLMKLAGIEI